MNLLLVLVLNLFVFVHVTLQSEPIATITVASITVCADAYYDSCVQSYFQITAFLTTKLETSVVFQHGNCLDCSKTTSRQYEFDLQAEGGGKVAPSMNLFDPGERIYLVTSLSSHYSTASRCESFYIENQQMLSTVFESSSFLFELPVGPKVTKTISMPLNGTVFNRGTDMGCSPSLSIGLSVSCTSSCNELYSTTSSTAPQTSFVTGLSSTAMQSSTHYSTNETATTSSPTHTLDTEVILGVIIAILLLIICFLLVCLMRLFQQSSISALDTIKVILRGFPNEATNRFHVSMSSGIQQATAMANNELYT